MLEIAMALRLKGIAGSDAIAEMTGRELDEVEGALQTMVEAGHAQAVSYTHLTLPTILLV